eukprot:m.61045 g.61045  ORF g.61045 m.61045 type:complete len:432 (+) comp7977_c0_seq1:50-1345(+)
MQKVTRVIPSFCQYSRVAMLRTYTQCSSSKWESVQEGPPDAIFGLTEKFKRDPSPNKMNLGVGAYRDDHGKPFILDCVRKAEKLIASDPTVNKEYATIAGIPAFCEATRELAFGTDCDALKDGRIATVQSISGTGALRLAFEFLATFYAFPNNNKTIFISNPTWGNHKKIIESSGLNFSSFRYITPQNTLDFDGMMEDLKAMDNGSVVLLHACAHNPTGVDPTHEQWEAIAEVFAEKGHVPFFDMAYQGFASGDCAYDAYAVRYFTKRDLFPLVAQSYSKNLGLYGERCGALNVVTSSPEQTAAVFSQLKIIIRPMYSNPPIHGALIATRILNDADLSKTWCEEIGIMSSRIRDMRMTLVKLLEEKGSTHDWSHITRQIGMFCFSGLTKEQVDILINDYHIYLTQDGRISMAGVSSDNVDYLATAIHEITK